MMRVAQLVFLQLFGVIFAVPYSPNNDTPPRFYNAENDEFHKYLGDRVKLYCNASGGVNNVVHWYRNGELLTELDFSRSHYRKIDKYTMEIKNLEVPDQGIWTCLVNNTVGSISRNYTIDIIDLCDFFKGLTFPDGFAYPPECVCIWFYTVRPENRSIDYASIEQNPQECQPYSAKIRAAQSLLHVPTPLPTTSSPPTDATDDNSTTTTLFTSTEAVTKNVLVVSLTPIIKATPRPKHSEEEIDATETTKKRRPTTARPTKTTNPPEPPQFSNNDYAEMVTRPAGQTIRLNCKASGTNIQYVWHKNGAVLVQGSPRATGYMYGLRNHFIELEDAVPSDSGVYTCEVHNHLGSIQRRFIVRVVERLRSAPVIVPNVLKNQTVNVNGTASFSCEVISDLTPHILWVRMMKNADGQYYFYNDSAHETMFGYTSMETYPKALIVNTGNSSTLRLANVTVEDQGVYACITGNSLGKVMANATLTVTEFYSFIIPTGEERAQTDASPLVLILSLVLVGLLLLLFGVILAYYFCIRMNKKKMEETVTLLPRKKKVVVTRNTRDMARSGWTDLPSTYQIQIIDQAPHGGTARQSHVSSDLTINCEYEIEGEAQWEIDRSRVHLLDVLGEGAFGEVWRGVVRIRPEDYPNHLAGSIHKETDLPVAVKKLKSSAHERELRDLVLEMYILMKLDEVEPGVSQAGRENVLKLTGCCTGTGPLYVILELCPHGNLRDFLRAHRPREEKEPAKANGNIGDYLEPRKIASDKTLINPLTQRHLVEFAYQVANGMNFLREKQIIHRDLAARNVLVAENFVMKISDFGLSRNTSTSRDYYRKRGNGRLPIKWMALEALESHMYTTESDVWSYGILLWEIMTLGGTPYPTIAMPQLFSFLKDGYRMEAPHNCPDEIYKLMIGCWQEARQNRPSFDVIVHYLQWMLSQSDEAAAASEEMEIDTNRSGSSTSDLEHMAPPPPSDDNEDGGRSRRRARPLSAPVVLPSEPMPHSICDDEDCDIDLSFELEDRQTNHDSALEAGKDGVGATEKIPLLPRAATRTTSSASSSSSSTSTSGGNSSSKKNSIDARRPPPLPARSCIPPSDSVPSRLSATQGIHSLTIDSALGSPTWTTHEASFDPHSEYAVPVLGPGRAAADHEYMNVSRTPGASRFPFPPLGTVAAFPPASTSRYSASCAEAEASTSHYAQPRVSSAGSRRHSVDSRASSGRGGSSAMSSAEGLGGISEMCTIEQLPSRIPRPIPSPKATSPSTGSSNGTPVKRAARTASPVARAGIFMS